MRAQEFISEQPESREGSEDFQGIQIEWQQTHPNIVQLRARSGGKTLGQVEFRSYDGRRWTGEELHVDPRYRRQGIATAMYDWFKRRFGPIRPSDAQTQAGQEFWQGKRVWEQEFIREGNDLGTMIKSFVASPAGQKYREHDCKTVTRAFVAWADQNGIPTQVISLAPPSAAFIEKNPRFRGKSGEGDAHIMPVVAGNAIDFTVRQFGINRPFEDPLITPINSMKSVYGRFGYFTDAPEWFLGGKSHWMGPLRAIPREIFNQDFGDEILEQGVAENFADGRVKGRSRPGRVKRAGASCKGSVTDLRARAKKYGGERGRMYHWCANMKSGRSRSK